MGEISDGSTRKNQVARLTEGVLGGESGEDNRGLNSKLRNGSHKKTTSR